MDASEIIAALGGPVKVATRFGVSRTTVYGWRHEGIPARFWLAVLDAAAEDGLPGITRTSVCWRPAQPRQAQAA